MYLQFAFEKRIKNNTYTNIELGLAPWASTYAEIHDRFWGTRFRADIRWYRQHKRHNKNFNFAAIEWLTKYETWHQDTWVERYGGAYSEQIAIRKNKLVFGINGLVGQKMLFNQQTSFIEWVVGAGFKTRKMQESDLPPDANVFESENTFEQLFFAPKSLLPNVVCGLKLGLSLDQRR